MNDPIVGNPQTVSTEEQFKSHNNVALAVYILQLVSLVIPFTSVIGVIINYVKMDDVRGTFFESHFRWQIRTFWFTLLWSVVGGILVFIGVGIIILFATVIWFIYRAVKGLLRLNDRKPMYQTV